MTDRAGVARWVAAYERAWRSPGTEALNELFTPDATYMRSPYAPAVTGLGGPGRPWTNTSDADQPRAEI